MGKNKSVLIHYNNYTVLKKIMHNCLFLLIICDSKALNIGSLYDVVEELEENFREVDKVVEHVEKND